MFNPFAEKTDADTSDVALVDQAKRGDRGALEKLVVRHQAWIYNIAIRMVFHPRDAEHVRDVAGETVREIDDVVERQHAAIFRDHPFLQPSDQIHWLRCILQSGDVRAALHLN